MKNSVQAQDSRRTVRHTQTGEKELRDGQEEWSLQMQQGYIHVSRRSIAHAKSTPGLYPYTPYTNP